MDNTVATVSSSSSSSTIVIEQIKTDILECFLKNYPRCILSKIDITPTYTKRSTKVNDDNYSVITVHFASVGPRAHNCPPLNICKKQLIDNKGRDLKCVLQKEIDTIFAGYVPCLEIESNTEPVRKIEKRREELVTMLSILKPSFNTLLLALTKPLRANDPRKVGSRVYSKMKLINNVENEIKREKEENVFYYSQEKIDLIRRLETSLREKQHLLYEETMKYFENLAYIIAHRRYSQCFSLQTLREHGQIMLLYEESEFLAYSGIRGYTKRERIAYYLYNSNPSFRVILYTLFKEEIDVRIALFKKWLITPDLAHHMLEEYILDGSLYVNNEMVIDG